MVRLSKALLKEASSGVSNTLSQILVCPLSKQPLRYCEASNSLISDTIGVAFPIRDGIPCLVPKDGRIIENDDALEGEDTVEVLKKLNNNIPQSQCEKLVVGFAFMPSQKASKLSGNIQLAEIVLNCEPVKETPWVK